VKLKVCLTVAMTVLLVAGASLTETKKLHPAGGLLFRDPYTVPGMKILDESTIPRRAITETPPSAVDLTAEMPPVGDQGNQGSCVAWAAGYYDKTHIEYVERQLATPNPTYDLDDPAYQISPSFIYNQINAGRDAGASMMDAQILICDQGACSMTDFPYDDADYTSWPTEAAYENAIPYRGYDAWGVNVWSDVGINQVKWILWNHHTCVLGINVFSNFDNIENYDTVYTVHDKSGKSRGGHALCIVGYDDGRRPRCVPAGQFLGLRLGQRRLLLDVLRGRQEEKGKPEPGLGLRYQRPVQVRPDRAGASQADPPLPGLCQHRLRDRQLGPPAVGPLFPPVLESGWLDSIPE